MKIGFNDFFLMEQVTGIEPAPEAWEASVLPLNYTCKMSVKTDIYITPSLFKLLTFLLYTGYCQ